MPTIWVDADATPKAVREIICKAAIRTEMTTRFVANHRVPVTPHPCITSHQVEPGFDVADNYIAQEAVAGDLLITQGAGDIGGVAARLAAAGVTASE